MRKLFKSLILMLLLSLPVVTWALIKPVRVISPELVGLTCTDNLVCIDDLNRLEEAKKLYKEAISFVQAEVGQIDSLPKAIFCASKQCSSQFGLYKGSYGHAGAYNVGTFGLVISYRGWHSYYVRHELIHHLQNERLGSINAWFFKPDWFKEGMAYSLSKDPRHPLPKKLEEYREKYDTWAKGQDMSDIWKAAQKL